MGDLPSYWRQPKEAATQEQALKEEIGQGRQAGSALHKGDLRLHHFLEKLPAAAYTCDPEGLITYFNQYAVQLWGRAPKLIDPVDRFCGSFKLFWPDGSPIAHDQCWMALALKMDSGYNSREIVIECPDGQRRTALAHANPIHDESGELIGAVNVLIDITERERVEEERVRLLAREWKARAEAEERRRISRELHDRVAHAMGVVHQSLELHATLAEGDPSRAEEKLQLARETTRRALDQTRSLAAELKRLQEEELEDGLPAAFEALAQTSVPDGVDVDLDLSGDGSAILKHVGVQVYLVMREALRNAVRRSGCARLRIRLEVGNGQVFGRVEDDGSGFDPEAVGKASPSWGMGLRSMAERAEMLGGELRVASRPGAGTRMEVRIPLDGRGP